MALTQVRYWNYKADDATKDIIRWLLGILPKGLYYGFDFVGAVDLTFKLNQATTGQTETDVDNEITAKIGKFITPQGVVVHAEGDVDLSISAGHVTHPRIDLVVATFELIQTVGGSDVVISVLEGVAAASPVAPALPFPEKQIILGQIAVPANTVATAALTYTKPNYLTLGNRPDNFAYLDRDQVWTYVQKFSELGFNGWGVATSPSDEIVLPTKGNLVATTITGDVETISVKPEGTPLKIFFAFDCTLTVDDNIVLPGAVVWPIKAGDIAEFTYYASEGGWVMTSLPASELARKSQPNKFTRTNTGNSGTVSFDGANLEVSDDGNIFYLPNGTAINQITTMDDETEILIRAAQDLTIAHNFAATTGFSKILCPFSVPARILAGEWVRLLMRSGNWNIVGGNYMYQRRFKKSSILT